MAELRITTDPSALDVGLIHRFLSEQSTWAKGISQDLVERALATSDAHGLYRQFGFTALQKPDSFMERYFPDIYVSRADPE